MDTVRFFSLETIIASVFAIVSALFGLSGTHEGRYPTHQYDVDADGSSVSVSFMIADGHVLGEPFLDGSMILKARAVRDGFGNTVLDIQLDAEGTEIFARVTEENIDKECVIVIDGIEVMRARIRERIGGGMVQVSGISPGERVRSLARKLSR